MGKHLDNRRNSTKKNRNKNNRKKGNPNSMTERERKESVMFFGGIAIRSTLIVLGIVLIIVGIVFVFIIVDGPFGEIAFISAGITVLFIGITGKTPTEAVVQRLARQTAADRRRR